MNFIKHCLTATLLLFIAQSCSNDTPEFKNQDTNKNKEITFSSIIDNNNFGGVNTRAMNATWEVNDKIGVYMYQSNNTLTSSSIIDNINNFSFITLTGNSQFTSNENIDLFFPKDKAEVNFIAYYPFSQAINNFKYSINIEDQSNLSEIDFMYSDNLKNNKISDNKQLTFKHKLSKLDFVINTNTAENVDIALKDVYTKASFDLSNGQLTIDQSTKQTINKTSKNNSIEFILIPSALTELEFIISIDGKQTTKKIQSINLKEGIKNTFTLNIKDDNSTEIENSQYSKWTETPQFKISTTSNYEYVNYFLSGKNSNNEYLRNYSMLYDKENRVALWIAFPLHQYYMGTTNRTNNWIYTDALDFIYQPDVRSKSWPNKDGNFDRGHQIASSDRTGSKEMNAMTFFTTNATLQKSSFNQGTWNQLEQHLQSIAKTATDTLYIVTGIILSDGSQAIQYDYDNSNRKCAVPQYFYKAIYRRKNNKDITVAYKMANSEKTNLNFENYKLSVSDLEKETGFTYFPAVPQAVKSEIGNIN